MLRRLLRRSRAASLMRVSCCRMEPSACAGRSANEVNFRRVSRNATTLLPREAMRERTRWKYVCATNAYRLRRLVMASSRDWRSRRRLSGENLEGGTTRGGAAVSPIHANSISHRMSSSRSCSHAVRVRKPKRTRLPHWTLRSWPLRRRRSKASRRTRARWARPELPGIPPPLMKVLPPLMTCPESAGGAAEAASAGKLRRMPALSEPPPWNPRVRRARLCGAGPWYRKASLQRPLKTEGV